jgi:tRNA 2-selenouridine synthase
MRAASSSIKATARLTQKGRYTLFQDITLDELIELKQKKELITIDVRSPSEFKDASIPGSVNIPLFNDEERAEIGTLYKQVNVQAAMDRGLEIVSAKLPAFIRTFREIKEQKAVFCWRGGMRSKTSATVLSLMGIRVYRLIGGVRAYRKWVVDAIGHMELPEKAYVLNGNTGSGKTDILRRLKEQGYPVLDLEGMANHRGSIFGEIGLEANNQKTFESLLVQDVQKYKDSPYMLLEAESKRVGKVVLPEIINHYKERGTQLVIDLPMAERVKCIIQEYQPDEHKEECLQAFAGIKKRIHTPIAQEIEAHLNADRFEEAVQLLLEHYYDPRYKHATHQYSPDQILIKAQTIDEAVDEIANFLKKQDQ